MSFPVPVPRVSLKQDPAIVQLRLDLLPMPDDEHIMIELWVAEYDHTSK